MLLFLRTTELEIQQELVTFKRVDALQDDVHNIFRHVCSKTYG